jgi:hypothetical protein
LVCGLMLCIAVRGLTFRPQMKFMYQIYLFFTPLHCHPVKCNPDHITVLCRNQPLPDQSPTPYIELSDWTTNCSVILPFGIMGWGIPDMRYYWQMLVWTWLQIPCQLDQLQQRGEPLATVQRAWRHWGPQYLAGAENVESFFKISFYPSTLAN